MCGSKGEVIAPSRNLKMYNCDMYLIYFCVTPLPPNVSPRSASALLDMALPHNNL